MALASYLDSSRIVTQAAPADKAEALQMVSSLLAEGGNHTQEAILQVLEERERLATTGVGSGVAVPHGRLDVSETRAALLIVPQGVAFDAIDGRDVHLVVGVLAPEAQPTKLLRMLADASRVLRESETRRQLVACTSEEEAMTFLQDLER